MDKEPEDTRSTGTPTLEFDLEGWVAGLAQAVVQGIERQTSAHGLTALEFALLRALVERRERSFSQLGDVLPIDREQLVQLVGKLVDRGLLRYGEGGADPRAVLLALTMRGRYLAWRLCQHVQAQDSRLLEGVSEEEMATLSSVVSRIMANHALLEQSSPR